MNSTYTFVAENEAATTQFGNMLAEQFCGGEVVGLIGTLGSGKTRLVQAIAAPFGVDARSVVSPTYVLLHEYPGSVPLFHYDLYRVADRDEWAELGVDEIFEGEGIVLLEWADRFRDQMPDHWLEITIEVLGEHQRSFTCIPHGQPYEKLTDALRSRLTS